MKQKKEKASTAIPDDVGTGSTSSSPSHVMKSATVQCDGESVAVPPDSTHSLTPPTVNVSSERLSKLRSPAPTLNPSVGELWQHATMQVLESFVKRGMNKFVSR